MFLTTFERVAPALEPWNSTPARLISFHDLPLMMDVCTTPNSFSTIRSSSGTATNNDPDYFHVQAVQRSAGGTPPCSAEGEHGAVMIPTPLRPGHQPVRLQEAKFTRSENKGMEIVVLGQHHANAHFEFEPDRTSGHTGMGRGRMS